MKPFQSLPLEGYQPAPKAALQQPQDALMVVDNRQLQVWSGGNFSWQQHLRADEDQGAAATLVGLTTESQTASALAAGGDTPMTYQSPSSSASASTSPAPLEMPHQKKRVLKKRKATHTIRKEQKAALEREIEELQKRLDAIKFQALVQQGDPSRSYQDRVVENTVLRESIQNQHLAMAQVRALLSGHTQHYNGGVRPMETKICLGADRTERRQVLHALRGAKLRQAYRFLQARSHGLDPTTPYFQEERFETAGGDFCISRFEITPMRGVTGGVRAVYDAVLQATFNAEIIISEASGHITIREEDDDLNDDNVSQLRLVSQTNRGVLLENNLVHFAEFSPGESGVNKGASSYAMTATDFIDEDELYPYRPLERVRRDATAAMLVTSYMSSTLKASVKGGNSRALDEEESELVVVITRWSCSRICHTDLDLPKQAILELRESSVRSGNTFSNCVREILGLPISPS